MEAGLAMSAEDGTRGVDAQPRKHTPTADDPALREKIVVEDNEIDQ